MKNLWPLISKQSELIQLQRLGQLQIFWSPRSVDQREPRKDLGHVQLALIVKYASHALGEVVTLSKSLSCIANCYKACSAQV